MARIECPECGTPADDQDFACSHCELILNPNAPSGRYVLTNPSIVRALIAPPNYSHTREEVPKPPPRAPPGVHEQVTVLKQVSFNGDEIPRMVAGLDMVLHPLHPFEAYVVSFFDGSTSAYEVSQAAQLRMVEVNAVLSSLLERGVIAMSPGAKPARPLGAPLTPEAAASRGSPDEPAPELDEEERTEPGMPAPSELAVEALGQTIASLMEGAGAPPAPAAPVLSPEVRSGPRPAVPVREPEARSGSHAVVPSPGAPAPRSAPPAAGAQGAVLEGKESQLKSGTHAVVPDVRPAPRSGPSAAPEPKEAPQRTGVQGAVLEGKESLLKSGTHAVVPDVRPAPRSGPNPVADARDPMLRSGTHAVVPDARGGAQRISGPHAAAPEAKEVAPRIPPPVLSEAKEPMLRSGAYAAVPDTRGIPQKSGALPAVADTRGPMLRSGTHTAVPDTRGLPQRTGAQPAAPDPKAPPPRSGPKPAAPEQRPEPARPPPRVIPRPLERVPRQDPVKNILENAVSLERRGEVRGAIEVLKRGISKLDRPAPLYNKLALILVDQRRDYGQAEELLNKAIELDPENSVYQQNLLRIVGQAAAATVPTGEYDSPKSDKKSKPGLLSKLWKK